MPTRAPGWGRGCAEHSGDCLPIPSRRSSRAPLTLHLPLAYMPKYSVLTFSMLHVSTPRMPIFQHAQMPSCREPFMRSSAAVYCFRQLWCISSLAIPQADWDLSRLSGQSRCQLGQQAVILQISLPERCGIRYYLVSPAGLAVVLEPQQSIRME